MNTQRCLFVGLGRQAIEHRLPAAAALAADDGVELVCGVDAAADEARARIARFAEDSEYRAAVRRRGYAVSGEACDRLAAMPVIGDLDEALSEHHPHLVMSQVPNQHHAPVAIRCLDAGANVLTEKPMAPTLAACERMSAAAWRNGRLLMTGYHLPYAIGPVVTAARSSLSGRVGAVGRWTRSDGIPGDAHFWDDALTGGVIPDLGGHMVPMIVMAVGSPPVRVTARGSSDAGRALFGSAFRASDSAHAVLEHENGALSEIVLSWATRGPIDEACSLQLIGMDTGATVEVPTIPQKAADYIADPDAFVSVGRHEHASPPVSLGEVPRTYVEAIGSQVRNFFRASRGDELPLLTLDQTLDIERVVVGMSRSALNDGRWQELSELS